MFSFQRLDAWKVALEYRGVVMRGMKKGVSRSMRDQIERSTGSILSNIGEGAGRFNPAEKRYFYDVARASTSESASQLFTMHQDGVFGEAEFETAIVLADRIARMLFRLIQSVSRSETPTDAPTNS